MSNIQSKRIRSLKSILFVSSSLVLTSLSYNNCSQQNFAFDKTDASKEQILSTGQILIENGNPYTNKTDVQVNILSSEAVSMYITNDPSCESGGKWEPLAAARIWGLDSENGKNNVYARLKDKDGIVSKCLTDDILHDNIPPSVSFSQKPPAESASTSATIAVDANDLLSGVSEVECREDSQNSFSPCPAVTTMLNIKEGPHSFIARARDAAGNYSKEIILDYLVDLTAPSVRITSAPSSNSGDREPRIVFEGQDDLTSVAKYECRLEMDSEFQTCTSPFQVPTGRLIEGANGFYVRAIDRVGNKSGDKKHNWSFDGTAPSVRITKGPSSYMNNGNATLEFEGTDNGTALSSFMCEINGGGYSSCTSSKNYSGLSQGTQTFSLRAADAVGNLSAPVSYSWVVDVTKPTISITSGPGAYTNQQVTSIGYTAQDVGSSVASVECSLDGTPVTCSKTMASLANLSAGNHSFSVVAVDAAGNRSNPAVKNWAVDLVIPIATITKVPPAYVNLTAATIEFTGSDAGGSGVAGFECRLDSGLMTSCMSPHDYSGLANGSHIVTVVAKDRAGNTSLPVSASWTIDLLPPEIHFVQRPVNQDFRRLATIELAVTDAGSGLKSVSCRLNGVKEACDATFKKTYDLGVGSYEFTVEATDNVGNSIQASTLWQEADLLEMKNQVFNIEDAAVDILFVVDNSGSMEQEHKDMSSRIQNFVSKLDRLNWQMAMVTTDPRSNAVGGDGNLLSFKGGEYILNSAMPTDYTQDQLKQTIQMPTDGSGTEQGINSTYRTLERAMAGQVNNKDFIRSNAHLSVVLISDEDESDSKAKNQPDNLINYVKATWGGKKMFSFNSIVTIPNDTACLKPNGTGASYGHRYKEITEKTGGILGSVCDSDYGALLSRIGDGVRNLILSMELNCEPQDVDGNGFSDVTITLDGGGTPPPYTVMGNKVVFTQPLPVGNHSAEYYCLKLNP